MLNIVNLTAYTVRKRNMEKLDLQEPDRKLTNMQEHQIQLWDYCDN
jgi:hypothetical protein